MVCAAAEVVVGGGGAMGPYGGWSSIRDVGSCRRRWMSRGGLWAERR